MTVVVVTGCQRHRAERNLACLLSQTALDSMEIVVTDTTPYLGTLRGSEHASVRCLQRPDLNDVSSASAEAVRQARGEIIAFLEDHSYPSPGWAEAVIEAYNRPVAMVNYAFIDTEPQTYLSRSFLMTEYGRWMAPVRPGPILIAASNNISYRREVLLRFEDRLEDWLKVEYLMHRRIRELGGIVWLEPMAIVAHENWVRLTDGLRANAAMKRVTAGLLTSMRGRWRLPRRFFYAAAMTIAPALHLWRLARSLWNRPSLWLHFLAALPVSVAVYCYASYYEALGYLFGPGHSREEFNRVELAVARKQ
jgi:hypothetical protein